MKKIALLIVTLFCFAAAAKAQDDQPDYCKQISRDTVSTKHTYQSPYDKISIKSEVTAGEQHITIDFNTTDFSLYEEAGLYIKFTDGKFLRFFGQKVDHKYISAVTGYSYETVLTVSPEKLEYFKTKKIAVFQIASIDVDVNDDTATQFMAYTNCIANLK